MDKISGLCRNSTEEMLLIFKMQIPDLEQPDKSQLNFYSDGTLQILTSSENPNFKVMYSKTYFLINYQHYYLMQQMRI